MTSVLTSTLRAIRKKAPTDWSVILNPISSEITRREAVEKILEVFPISEGEAEELVQSAPVILLESLSEDDAVRLRDFFAEASIDISLSNDSSIRRRYYRTVWPEQPSVEFLKARPANGRSEPRTPQHSYGTRSLHSAPAFTPRTTETTAPFAPPQRKESVFDSVQRELKSQEALISDKIFNKDKERTREDKPTVTIPQQTPHAEDNRERIIDELREKLTVSQKELNYLRETNKKIEHALLVAEKEKAEQLTHDPMDFSNQPFDAMSLEQEKKYALMEERIEQLEEEKQRFASELVQIKTSFAKTEAERMRLAVQQDDFLKRLADQEEELSELRSSRKKQDEMEVENAQLRSRYERLMSENEEFQQRYEAVEDQKRFAESRAAELADESSRLRKEFEVESIQLRKELEQWRKRSKELESVSSENARVQEELRQTKERLKEFTINREQQESIAKRLRLQNEIVEREARLKDLVKKQELVEREIVERGQVIQQVLSEQEEIEKEIVSAKQAHKYLTEQIKSREKPRLKPRGRLEVKSPESFSEPQPV